MRKYTKFYDCEKEFDIPEVNNSLEVLGSEQVIENNRVVNKPKVVTVNFEELNQGLKVSDFYLENLIAAGSLGSLTQHYTMSGDSMSVADNIESQLSVLDNIQVTE